MLAAGEVGATVGEYQAQHIAKAACAFYNEIASVRQAVHREQWETPGFRDFLRRNMRHELLDAIMRKGLVPVSLPRETISYRAMTTYAAFADPDAAREVPESGPWDTAAVLLEIPLRRPEVDREAAVQAGLLDGAAP